MCKMAIEQSLSLRTMLIQIQTSPERQEIGNLENMSGPSLESEHYSVLAILDSYDRV